MPRDISGVYTLPLGNPVVPGTVIDTAWANPTMTDIAAQLNNVITRDGLLGYTAPAKFIDGSQLAPAIAFASEGGLGFYRKILNTLAVVSNNQEVALFKDDLISFQKNTNFAGNVTVTGTLTAPGGAVSPLVVGDPLLSTANIGNYISLGNDLNDGTPLSNSTIVVESQFRNANMQLRYSSGTSGYQWTDLAGTNRGAMSMNTANDMTFAIGGTTRYTINTNGTHSYAEPTSAAVPVLAVGPTSAGGFGIDVRGRASDNLSVIRLLSNDYVTQLLALQSDSTTAIMGTVSTVALQLYTNSVARVNIDTAGRFVLAPTTGSDPTFTTGAGSSGYIQSLRGRSSDNVGVVALYDATGVTEYGRLQTEPNNLYLLAAGARNLLFYTNGSERMRLQDTGEVSFTGTDARSGMRYDLGGFGTLGGVNNICGTSNTTAWSIWAGLDTINGAFLQLYGGSHATNPNLFAIGNNGTARAYCDGSGYWNFGGGAPVGGVSMRITHPGTTDVGLEIIRTTGGADVSLLSYDRTGAAYKGMYLDCSYFGLKESGTTVGFVDSSCWKIGDIGTAAAPPHALEVWGTNAASTTYTNAAARTGWLLVMDRGNAATNGGGIVFSAFSNQSPFAYIKGAITDASSNQAGHMYMGVRKAAADASMTPILQLSTDGAIYQLDAAAGAHAVAHDPGATAATTNMPIGSLIFANVGAAVRNAFTTNDASVTNMTVFHTNSGSSTTINFGTWRNLGARDNGTGFALWIRVS